MYRHLLTADISFRLDVLHQQKENVRRCILHPERKYFVMSGHEHGMALRSTAERNEKNKQKEGRDREKEGVQKEEKLREGKGRKKERKAGRRKRKTKEL